MKLSSKSVTKKAKLNVCVTLLGGAEVGGDDAADNAADEYNLQWIIGWVAHGTHSLTAAALKQNPHCKRSASHVYGTAKCNPET
eukprot:808199-Karenia_brevis.AAC.1